jgi:hypothetical protein
MPELAYLSHEERVFLAGCIRAVILAAGSFQESELKDLDKIYQKLDFLDYEKCLDEFEEKYPDESSFQSAAQGITRPAAQDLILTTVYDLTIQNGAPEDAQEGIFMRLTKLWEKK